MTPDPATRAREKADSLVTEWLDRWRGWVSLLKREAFVDLVDRIAAALTEPGRGPATGPDVERLREALSALVNACEDAFETPEEAADWARTGDMRGYLDTALAALRAPGPAGSATPDGPDGEKR